MAAAKLINLELMNSGKETRKGFCFLIHLSLLIFLCPFASLRDLSAADLSGISKAEIVATVAHIQRLAQDQQRQLAEAARQSRAKDETIAWQAQQITNLTLWGNRCEQAVKAIAMALAIALSLWIGTAFAGLILKNFPSFEGPMATAILYLGIFLGTYYGVMTCIFAVAPHIPTIPVWHDFANWAHGLHAPKL
jgi:hypothetical protein